MVFLLCFGMGITRPGTTVVTGRVFRGLLPVETDATGAEGCYRAKDVVGAVLRGLPRRIPRPCPRTLAHPVDRVRSLLSAAPLAAGPKAKRVRRHGARRQEPRNARLKKRAKS
jgi:hypothetical protein